MKKSLLHSKDIAFENFNPRINNFDPIIVLSNFVILDNIANVLILYKLLHTKNLNFTKLKNANKLFNTHTLNAKIPLSKRSRGNCNKLFNTNFNC